MKLRKLLIIVTAFAIAMGFLESAVVVYMREILYPGGFEFPLSPIPVRLAVAELLREVATLVMLVSIGILAGRRFSTGFAWFIYTFAIWDIFYYVFLWLLLGWPQVADDLGCTLPDSHHLDRARSFACTGFHDHDPAGHGNPVSG